MRSSFTLGSLALALVAAACGSTDPSSDAPSTDATRTIKIEMTDNEYVPDRIDVEAGETVRLVFTNNGAVTHDAFVGDEAAQDDHEDEMNGDMGGHGMGEDDIDVEPGKTGELTQTFRPGDDLLIGCHEPGHYDEGMRLAIVVR